MRCADCNTPILSDRGICDDCFQKRLDDSIRNREVVLKIDVDNPSNEYF